MSIISDKKKKKAKQRRRRTFLTIAASATTSGGGGSPPVAAWNNISTASYANKSFFVAAQEGTNFRGLTFSADGSKAYIHGQSEVIYQYTLSTPWDISTGSYVSKSFSTATQIASGGGIFFKSDGTAVYVIDWSNDIVYQYTLSTPWDISTASYASKSFSIATQEFNATGEELFISSDGTRLFIVGWGTDNVYSYTMSTAWDISTASYDSKSFSVVTQDANPTSLSFHPDGKKMYIAGFSSKAIFQYTLGTAWDLSTASYDTGETFDVSGQVTYLYGVSFNPDGSSFYTVDDTLGNKIDQYSL